MDRKIKRMNVKQIFNLLPQKQAFAHCDIPCGIYDPHQAQLAAHTIIKMTKLLQDLGEKKEDDLISDHSIARITHVKEKHSDILEEELETLRNDYFKPEHFESYKELNQLFVDTLKLSAKARQSIDMDVAMQTLSKVLEISEIFYKTKGVEPVRVKSVYPTEGEVVIYK
jgi:nickel superoxide dismutase